MPAEREKFWSRLPTQEIHDLEAEAKYNNELVSQVQVCYGQLAASSLWACKVEHLRFDTGATQTLPSDGEYLRWQVSPRQGAEEIFPLKRAYLQSLSARLLNCIKSRQLRLSTGGEFRNLYSTVEVLSRAGDNRELQVDTANAKVSQICHRFGCNSSITLSDLKATYDSEDEVLDLHYGE